MPHHRGDVFCGYTCIAEVGSIGMAAPGGGWFLYHSNQHGDDLHAVGDVGVFQIDKFLDALFGCILLDDVLAWENCIFKKEDFDE